MVSYLMRNSPGRVNGVSGLLKIENVSMFLSSNEFFHAVGELVAHLVDVDAIADVEIEDLIAISAAVAHRRRRVELEPVIAFAADQNVARVTGDDSVVALAALDVLEVEDDVGPDVHAGDSSPK